MDVIVTVRTIDIDQVPVALKEQNLLKKTRVRWNQVLPRNQNVHEHKPLIDPQATTESKTWISTIRKS